MKSLVYRGVGDLALEERSKPRLQNPTDIIARVVLSGVCGTDRKIRGGGFPAQPGVILGHEAVGIVEETGPDARGLRVGDRVVIDPTLHCGDCLYCREGRYNFCDNRDGMQLGVDADGTFARYIRLPAKFFYPIPDEISFERAVFVEPLACVLNNIEAAALCPDDTVAVLGAGPIGMIAGMICERLSSHVTLVENHPSRVRFARRFFADVVDSGNRKEWLQAVIECNGGRKPRIVIDTTGVLLAEALELADRGGKCVAMGFQSSYRATISPLYLTNNGISIIGAGDYNRNLQKSIRVAAGIDLEKLVTHRFRLGDFEEAFHVLDNGDASPDGVMKVLFQID